MEKVVKKAMEALINKSKETRDSNEALKFSQAALNIAHAFETLRHVVKN